ncbi:MAG: permease [Blautia sp.]|nr:permease [Blautia sp.]
MSEILHREFVYLWYYTDVQLHQIGKYYLLGILVGSFVSVFLKKYIHEWMTKLNGKKPGWLGIVFATVLGIISPLCMYGTIPIVASLNESGMREDWIAAFMMSSILMNPQLFFYSMALGMPIAILRLFLSILGGLLAGFLVMIFFHDKPFYHFTAFFSSHNRDTDPVIIKRYIKNVGRNLKATLPYFAAGILLTALYQRYVPQTVVASLFSVNKGFGSLLAAGLGVPLYTCGGGTIPLISEWLYEGMSVGSAAAFMIAGPGTKLTNLGALKSALGIKNFVIYIIYVILFAALSGLVIDLIGF